MKKSGFGGFIALLFILALLMWGLAILLYVLAVAIPVAAAAIGVALTVHGWKGVHRRREVAGIDEQIAGMAADSATQLNDMISQWDYTIFTKGIGTPLQQALVRDPVEVHRQREELIRARSLLDAAPATPYRIEAIIAAERTRSRLGQYLR